MKKTILIIGALMAFVVSYAQQSGEGADTPKSNQPATVTSLQPFIGYLSYDSTLVAMHQYAIAQAKIKELRDAYNNEVKRVEEEFNQKYEAFLEGQRDFPRTILLKRQNELQDLMQRNLEFKQQGRRDLQQAEAETMSPLRQQLSEAIATIARKHALALVVNTDSDACPFLEPSLTIDIQQEVINLLNK